ncbi:MAG: hypothetical protein KGL37_13660 [Acidobacteriota bacterium]|nr:hypothetical protein [Acidobacteriota bacterium]
MSPISRRSFFGRATAGVAALSAFGVTGSETANAQAPCSTSVPLPEIRVAILGDPCTKIEWTDGALEALRKIGFNAIQLNIAWGTRVFGEPLSLIDVVTVPGEKPQPETAKWHEEIGRRAAMAKRHVLRTIFHFGSPYLDYNPYTGEVRRIGQGGVDDRSFDSNYDVANPLVTDHEVNLLRELRRSFPDIDDIQVYTYDQDAWQTAEFQGSKYSEGIPLSDRLPPYLKKLHQVWTEGRIEKHCMWWEPWELSAGQVYAILPQLPSQGFGLMIHTNIGEVQRAVPVDLWFRNTVRICHSLKIPVIAEAFWASHNEEIEPLSIPAPRLADEAYLAIMRVPGIVGIKEYYGLLPQATDLDLDVLRIRLSGFTGSTAEAMRKIAEPYGPAREKVLEYISLLSDARQMYPWDASWHGREVGRAKLDHGWAAATIRGEVANTPDWRSTRRTVFMQTDNSQPHFWLLEDVELRFRIAADITQQALDVGREVISLVTSDEEKTFFSNIQRDADYFRRVSLSYALHIRETNIALQLRQDIAWNRPLNERLVAEMGKVFDADVANQDGKGRVVEMKRLFAEDATEFVSNYLLPTDVTRAEMGGFTLTTR